jgi:hypothetical protein
MKKPFVMVRNTKKMKIFTGKFIGESSDVQIAEPIVPPVRTGALWKN